MGRVIGKAGATINRIREESGARIDAEDRNDDQCEFKISGSAEAVAKAKRLIEEVANRASTGGEGGRLGRGDDAAADGPSDTMDFPVGVMGGIIGAKGAKIMDVRQRSGARVLVEKDGERCRVQISGTREQIDRAREMIQRLVDEDQGVPVPTGGAGGGEDGEVVSETLEYPVAATGRIIGSRGGSIAEVRSQSGARISVEKGDELCRVSISGTPTQVRRARRLIQGLAEDGITGTGIRRGEAEDTLELPSSMVGRVIGKGGETIQRLQKESGARIDVNTNSGDPCIVRFSGSRDAVARARFLVAEVLDKWSGQASDRGPGGMWDPAAQWGAGPPYGAPGFGWPAQPDWQAAWPMGMSGLAGAGMLPPAGDGGGGGQPGAVWDYSAAAGRRDNGGGGDAGASHDVKNDIDLDEL